MSNPYSKYEQTTVDATDYSVEDSNGNIANESDIPESVKENAIKIKNGVFANDFLTKEKTNIRAGMIGGLSGLIYGMFARKNLFFCAIVGSIAGYGVNALFLNKKPKPKKND